MSTRRLTALAGVLVVAAVASYAGLIGTDREALASPVAVAQRTAVSPSASELLARGGRWQFGRVGGAKLCDVVLTSTRGRYGNVLRACHPNESFWSLDRQGRLFFRSATGATTTRFARLSATSWRGPYLGAPGIPAAGIVHYLRR